MTTIVALQYLFGSWLIGFLAGIVLRIFTRNYVEWFT